MTPPNRVLWKRAHQALNDKNMMFRFVRDNVTLTGLRPNAFSRKYLLRLMSLLMPL